MLNDTQIKFIKNLIKEEIGRLILVKEVYLGLKHEQEIGNSIDFYKKLLEDLGEK